MQINRTYQNILLAAVCALLLAEYAMDVIRETRYNGWGDFRAYYTAAAALQTGQNIYDSAAMNEVWNQFGDPSLKPDTHGYVYPPLLAILFQPLTFFSLLTAARIWLVFNAFLWFAGLALLFAFLNLRPKHILFWLLLFAGLRFEPVLWTLKVGQVNIIIFLLVMASLYSLKRGCAACAGFYLALGGVLKLTPLILVGYYLLRRQYRTVIWTGICTLALLAISCLFVGINLHVHFIRDVLPHLSQGIAGPYNQSPNGWFLRLFGAAGWSDHLSIARLLARLTGLVFLGITARRLWQSSRAPGNYDLVEISLCILLASFLSPITWNHHMVWVLLPLAVVFHHIAQPGTTYTTRALVLAAFLAIGVINDYYVHPLFQTGPLVLFSSIKLYGLLILYFILLKMEALPHLDTQDAA